jgi:predicted DNA-binding transcriptional regulator YafY
MLAGAGATGEREGASLPLIREALGAERKLKLAYVDKDGRSSTRVVWPVALGFFDHARMLAAWCETRADFRHFRLDRMAAVAVLDERPPKRRRALLIDWRRAEGLDE